MGAEDIKQYFQAYLDNFIKHKVVYQEQDGYLQRLASARICAHLLSQFNPKRKKELTELAATFRNDLDSLSQNYVW